MINKYCNLVLLLLIYSIYSQTASFVKTPDEIARYYNMSRVQLDHSQVLLTVWETKPDIIKGLLPKFLQPTPAENYVFNYMINPNSTNFGASFKETALFVRAQATYNYNGKLITVKGWYCIAGDTDNDMALITRREKMGFPFKIALMNLENNKKNNSIHASIYRKGITFFNMDSKIVKSNVSRQDNEVKQVLNIISNTSDTFIVFNAKAIPRGDDNPPLDFDPLLIQQAVKLNIPNQVAWLGKPNITFTPSMFDPWSTLEVVNMIGSIYMEASSMNFGPAAYVARETNVQDFMRYYYGKAVDPHVQGLKDLKVCLDEKPVEQKFWDWKGIWAVSATGGAGLALLLCAILFGCVASINSNRSRFDYHQVPQ